MPGAKRSRPKPTVRWQCPCGWTARRSPNLGRCPKCDSRAISQV